MNTRSSAKETPFTGPVWWIAGALLALALLLQVEVTHYLTWRDAEPSAVLVLVVWYALHADWRRAAVFGLIAGACEDALSAQTGASWTLSTTATALFAAVLSRWFFPDSFLIASAVAVLCTLLQRLVFWVSMALTMAYPPGYAHVHFDQALRSSLLNGALMVFAMFVIRRFGQADDLA